MEEEELDSMEIILAAGKDIDVAGVATISTQFLKINDQDLSEDMDNQAAYYVFWATAVADAQRDEGQAELNYKVTKAEVRRDIKESEAKFTVPDLNAAVDEDDRVIGARMQCIDAEHKVGLTKAIMYALQQKKDMLSSKSGLRRTELEVHMRELGAKVLGGNR